MQYNKMFDDILSHLLDITNSEYGFIGEVLYNDEGRPYLKTHAITNISWDEETEKFYNDNAPQGLEFFNLNSLFGQVLTTQQPVIANMAKTNSRSDGLPEGHPDLNAFLGVPLIVDNEMVGAMGVANRPGGYDTELVEKTQSLFNTIGQAIISDRYRVNLEKTQRALKSEQKFTSAVMDNANAVIIVLNKHGEIVSVNKYAESLINYTFDELVGQKVWDHLLKDTDKRAVKAVFDDPENKSFLNQFENSWATNNGTVKEIAWSNSALMDEQGKMEYIVSIGTDITERKRLEKMKDEFVSTVSHELRTPLTSILGALGLITGGATGNLPEQTQQLLNIANDNTSRLLLLISDILDLSKVESGDIEYYKTEVNIWTLAEQVINENQQYANQYNVSYWLINKNRGVVVYADPNRLAQVLNNLLSNAAKFSHENGKVEISIKQRNNKAMIEVKDYGVGISHDNLDRVFHKFSQVDSSDTRLRGGTGLGLSISQSIINQHGGKISVISELGKGSTFTIQLPLRASAASHLTVNG